MDIGPSAPSWDAFLSHASEDKADFVMPLAEALSAYGLRIWFDKFTLKLGDSLREKIDEGLAGSRFGIVVLSPSFFAKNWPKKELNGLFAREIDGNPLILPVWHQVDRDAVLRYSPMIADKIAITSADGIPAVARALVEVISPEALQTGKAMHNAKAAAGRLVQHWQDKRPDLGYRVSFGLIGSGDNADLPESILSAVREFADHGMRIDVFVKDAAAYSKDPITLSFTMPKESWDKVDRALRDGDGVTLGSSEILKFQSNAFEIVGLPPEDTAHPEAVIISPPRESLASNMHLQLIFEQDGEREEYPYIEFRKVRAGTELLELESVAPPIAMRLKLGLRPCRANVDISFCFVGHDIRHVRRAYRATRMLFSGGRLHIINLDTGASLGTLQLTAASTAGPQMDIDELIEAIYDTAEKLHILIPWGNTVTKEDAINALLMAAAVRTGTVQLQSQEVTLTLPENEIPSLEAGVSQGMILRFPVLQSPFGRIFGQQIDLGPHEIAFTASKVQVANASASDSNKHSRSATFTLNKALLCFFQQLWPRPSAEAPDLANCPILFDTKAYRRYAARILPNSALKIGAIRTYEQQRRAITAHAHTMVILELAACLADSQDWNVAIARSALAVLYEHCSTDDGQLRVVSDSNVTFAALLFNEELHENRKLAETLCSVAKTVHDINGALPRELTLLCGQLKELLEEWIRDICEFARKVVLTVDPTSGGWQPFTNDASWQRLAAAAMRRPEAVRAAARQHVNQVSELLKRTTPDDEAERHTNTLIEFCGQALQARQHLLATLIENGLKPIAGGSWAILDVLLAIDQEAVGLPGRTVLITGAAEVVKAAQVVTANPPVISLEDYLGIITTKAHPTSHQTPQQPVS